MSAAVRRRPVERYLPVGYFLGALALLVTLLPTILRPPPQSPPQSAEFSPDAPPDEKQDSIIASLQRGQSGTAGAGIATLGGGGKTAAVAAGVSPTLPPAKRDRACPYGYGTPPRQTESIYAPPCAAAFVGDNGGATTKGVTATEVRIGISPQTGGYRPSYDGPIRTTPDSSETPADRTWRVYQAYFNSRYELYGRQLRLYAYRGG